MFGMAGFVISNRKRIPVYIIQTAQLIREVVNDNDNITISYQGQEYHNLSSTRFVFWNSGRRAIKGNDIATRNPIRVTIDEQYQILDAYIDKQTDLDNNFIIEETDDPKKKTQSIGRLINDNPVAVGWISILLTAFGLLKM